jgi:hypothetical protein
MKLIGKNYRQNERIGGHMFTKGQEVDWVHGEHHRVATVLKVEGDRVFLSGIGKDYWIKTTTLLNKTNKPYPLGRANR